MAQPTAKKKGTASARNRYNFHHKMWSFCIDMENDERINEGQRSLWRAARKRHGRMATALEDKYTWR